MEAAQADTISSFFSWSIENFYTLAGDEHTSEPFLAGDYLWEVCIFPNADELSISLQVADLENLPVGWSRYANFDCSVVDLVDSQNTVQREIIGQKFVAESPKWGFPSFMPHAELYDSSKGFLMNDTLILNVWVTVAQETTPSSTFTWAIENFSSLWSQTLLSTDFILVDYGWYMTVNFCPCGSGDNANTLGLYLQATDSANLPRGWNRYIQLDLSVVDQVNARNTVIRGAKCKYSAKQISWGYLRFMPITDLHNAGTAFLVNDTLVIKAWASLAQDETTSSIFTWTVEQFSTLTETLFSDTFVAGTYKWRVSLHQQGRGEKDDTLSLYLHIVDTDEQHGGWSTYAECDISVADQVCNQYTVRKELQYKFSEEALGIGYSSFMPLCDLKNPLKGFLVNDTLVVKVGVSAGKVVEYHAYDSKIETGYVGLMDHGASSYINSLLQSLYHIPYFRKIVYKMLISEVDMPSRNISLQLQRLFYELQYSDYSVATKDLTDSLGWYTKESLKQHDVQELHSILRDAVEENAKGTLMEGSIQEIFEGHCMSYIDCINVKHTTKIKEPFYDLQLDVRGCRDVYASLDKYVCIERLDGDNKYLTEQHGLQDARKGVRFIDFPPVLQLQLKRVEYDFISDAMVKINDRYEFPLDLDLDQEKYLSPDADWKIRNLFTLHSILVHNGGEHGGRYHVLIRPRLCDQWLNFDDERITKECEDSALEEHYGGEEEPEMDLGPKETPITITKLSNAYMLVYIRKSDMEKIVCDVDENNIVEHHLEEVAKQFGIPVQFQRFWLWEKRKNHTYRPSRPLTPEEEIQSVGQLRELSKEAYSAELILFLEAELGPDLQPIQLSRKTNDNILLFFKLYDAENKLLSYVGHLLVKISGYLSEILVKLNKMADFNPSQELELYKEIEYEPTVVCERIDKKLTFRASKLKDGDIICYQKSSVVGEEYDYPDVPSFLNYQVNCQIIHFRSLQKPKDDEFSLRLWKLSDYVDVVERVAHELGIHKSRIRLTAHDYFSQQPKTNPINYKDVAHLSDMLVDCNQVFGILYYEKLNTPQVVPSSSSIKPTAPPTCVVCFDAPLEGICVPCGHMSCCMSCLEEIHAKNMGCPVCRAHIEHAVKVYSA